MKPQYFHPETTPQGATRFRCDVCPRACLLTSGQRGFCYVRKAGDDGVALDTFGRSSGFCIDPIEKKPLNHFLPGSSVLSFGTAGCNLGCRFCQNWDISKARNDDTLQDDATPEAIAAAAVKANTASVAFTYNDPTIFLEYAIETAKACHARGIKSVAVTNGYIHGDARVDLFDHMDAANIDLKAFTERFYKDVCLAHLEPVKETLRYVAQQKRTWLEITTLLIPGENDGDDEIRALAEFIATDLGPEVPLHFSAFHPDFQMEHIGPTPIETLRRARRLAKEVGLHHVYVGNVTDPDNESTHCASCDALLIGRDRYEITSWHIDGDRCATCGTTVPGVFAGPPGTWGRRRQRLHIVGAGG
jgi:pyruvate formate lyase activating enzyme